MTKDQLLSLWNADNWEVMSCGVYFTAHRADADKELHINCNDYTEAEILAMPFWERLAQELDELDRQAHEILQKEFPDDEDIPGLASRTFQWTSPAVTGHFPSAMILGTLRLGNSISMCPLTSSSCQVRRLATTPFNTGRLPYGIKNELS